VAVGSIDAINGRLAELICTEQTSRQRLKDNKVSGREKISTFAIAGGASTLLRQEPSSRRLAARTPEVVTVSIFRNDSGQEKKKYQTFDACECV
jgi:hypothetical protein